MKDHPSQWNDSGLTCRIVVKQASEYLDGRLSMLTKFLVGLHVVSCVHCRTYVSQLRLVRDAVGFFPKPYPSAIDRLRLQEHFVRYHSSRAVIS